MVRVREVGRISLSEGGGREGDGGAGRGGGMVRWREARCQSKVRGTLAMTVRRLLSSRTPNRLGTGWGGEGGGDHLFATR